MKLTSCFTRTTIVAIILLTIDARAGQSLSVYPRAFELSGERQQRQLIVDAQEPHLKDVTHDVTYTVDNSDVVSVDSRGVVRPLSDGRATILVSRGSDSATATVTVRDFQTVRPVSFDLEALPMLSRSGCSGGSCHGSPHGKAGFRLSLFGGDPAFDRLSLVREARGRRVSPLHAENSLLLMKPTMQVPHMGGRRFSSDDQAYKILHRWISEGCRVDEPDVRCTGIEVYPTASRILSLPNAQQQLQVSALFEDGSRRDVTHLAKFESSDPTVLSVSRDGFVKGSSRGDAAVMVRYLHHTKVPLLTCVRDVDGFQWPRPKTFNYIDQLVDTKLQQMQFMPSDVCSDEIFLRRVYLDVIGILPSPTEREQFLSSTAPDKRDQLIDALLDRPEYAKFWAQKWGDLLRISRRQIGLTSVFKFSAWLQAAVAENRPYDVMARQLLTAGGSTLKNPAGNYYRTSADTNDAMETSAQLFLGTRIQCAKCHNHPFERWTQDNYYGLASVFHRVGRKRTRHPEESIIFASTTGDVTHPVTGRVSVPWVPATGNLTIAEGQDRRAAFAEWLIDDSNPFFAAVEVNRIWAQVMGIGIVEPFDDFRDSNPPSNPDLLRGLADDFRQHGYDRRYILRTILKSRTYQAGTGNRTNRSDTRYFSHYRPRRLSAEQLVDAMSEVTGVPEIFVAMPRGTKATWLPAPDLKPHNRSELGSIDFLKVFGQPERQSVCECERGDETSLGQALQLLNGTFLHTRLTSKANRFRKLLDSGATTREVMEDLYLRALSRRPTEEELKAAIEHVKNAADASVAFEDICWVIVNKDEFLFQH